MAPFWNMVVLVVIFIAFNAFVYFTFFKRHAPDVPFYLIYRVHFIELAILIAETITYWIIRKWIIRKWLIWMHIGCIYCIIIGVPLMNAVYMDIVENFGEREMLNTIRMIINWSLLIIGHIFFAAAIINGYRSKKKQEEEELFELI